MSGAMPRKVYHKPHDRQYAYGSTYAAIVRAKRAGYDAIDLDQTWSLDSVRMINHWALLMKMDAWRDPHNRYPKATANVTRIPAKHLKEFTSPYGDLLSAVEALRVCKEVGIIPCLEAKTDRLNRDQDLALAKAFRKQCKDWNLGDPIIMTEPRAGKGIKALKAHHEAGFRTMWLWRGEYPARYDEWITYVKSRPGHGIYQVRK